MLPHGEARGLAGTDMATSYGNTPGAKLLAAEVPLGEEEEHTVAGSEQIRGIQQLFKLEKCIYFLSLTSFELGHSSWPLCCPAGSAPAGKMLFSPLALS